MARNIEVEVTIILERPKKVTGKMVFGAFLSWVLREPLYLTGHGWTFLIKGENKDVAK